jgi:alkanesulfonate monooxygenase SsuD/methylene tetrahydromethanopterin reductase-like flavin-dependent oxidoreductase (luciferase family)
MKFGYILENYDRNLSPENLIKSAQLAEKLNFHSIWVTDHIMQPQKNRLPIYNTISEAILTLMFLSGFTTSVKLGLSTLVLPLRNTILVGKQLATLDYLTNGRLISSFGAGWNKQEFEFLGMTFKNRGKRMNEQLKVIKALWKGETSFKGDYHTFEDVSFEPRSKFLADSPLLVAGNSKYAIKRAIKYGTGWHPSRLGPEDVSISLEPYKKELEGRNFEIWIRLRYNPVWDFKELISEYQENGVTGLVLNIVGNSFEDSLNELKKFRKYLN